MADIVVTTPSFAAYQGIAVGALTTSTPTPNSTAIDAFEYNSDPHTTSSPLTIPANGIGIVCAYGSQYGTPVWNVGTQDYYTNDGASMGVLLGHISAAGSQTPSISGYNGNGFGMVAASWGP